MNKYTKDGVSLSISVNGRPTQIYQHNGMFFIESRVGTEYCIELENHNWYRVEVVAAVDGLSVITGKPASKKDSGYIVNGYGKTQIKGFRKDKGTVGNFLFTENNKSYAAGKGGASNVGVIAIAVYREKQPTYSYTAGSCTVTTPYTIWGGGAFSGYVPPTTTGTINTQLYSHGTATNTSNVFFTNQVQQAYKVSNASSGTGDSLCFDSNITKCSAAKEEAIEFKHGTGWGKKTEDKVVEVTFERELSVAAIIFETYYNCKEALQDMGIKLIQEKMVTLPCGFPNDYAEPPANWQG